MTNKEFSLDSALLGLAFTLIFIVVPIGLVDTNRYNQLEKEYLQLQADCVKNGYGSYIIEDNSNKPVFKLRNVQPLKTPENIQLIPAPAFNDKLKIPMV